MFRLSLHRLQDPQYFLWEGRCQATGGRLPRTSHATWVLLLSARYAPHRLSRHHEVGERKLERGARPPRVAHVPRVYAAPVDRASDEIRPGCFDLVRRFESPGEIRRQSLP